MTYLDYRPRIPSASISPSTTRVRMRIRPYITCWFMALAPCLRPILISTLRKALIYSFFLLSILLVYLILSEILYSSTKWPLLITLFAALNPGVLNIAVFMRMYLMGMTMCLMLTYLQIKWLKKPSLAYALGLSIISLTGALTHYYFIFFCFFSWFFCLLYILKQKYARRSVLTYLLWPCLAGGLMLVLWPEVIKHVLYRSGRGTQSIWSLQHFGSQLSYYWDNIHANLFGRMLIFILPALLVVYLIRYKKSPKAAAPERQYAVFPLVVAALLLPSLMYFLLVAKISTFYLDERYMSLIYPLCIVLVMLFVAAAAVNRQSPLLRAISIVCCIVLVAGAWWSCDWSYSYRHWEKPIDEINASDASDAIVILSGEDEVWKVWTLYPLHQQVDSVTYIPADQLETAQGLLAGQTGQCLLVSCSKTIKDKINSALPAPQTLTVQEIKFGPSGYFTTYLVRQQ